MNFKFIDKKYRPIPFWSWNEKLDTDETRRQVRIMNDAGIGGYFMHARGGLLTEYMSDEWFDNVGAAIEEGDKLGMYSWAYDENGWPSGFGGGAVNGLGVEYQQKWLNIEDATDGCEELPETLLVKDGYRYFYKVNPLYVDNLDEKVVREFINFTHKQYHERFPNRFEGFFTDEPQIGRGGKYHWSFILEEKFTERYGYSLVENLDALFHNVDGCAKVRIDYWHLLTDLFSNAFFKQIYDWCEEHGYKQTGHLVMEGDFRNQILCNGSCMPHYEYFHIPGMDWLGRSIDDDLAHIQLGSAAAQLGKKQVLSETFALCGHNVSHDHLKRIFEWQMVRGVNLLCTHLEGYSLRGLRKRDYPPAMYYQQPWWRDMDLFFDAMSRIGMLLAEGEIVADTLLIHPIVSSWALYNGNGEFEKNEAIEARNKQFHREIRTLENKHILFHLGDEVMMERHARVEGGKLIIGRMSYSTVVIPEHDVFLPTTEKLINEFRRQGGRIITADEADDNPILPNNRLSYTMRRFPEFDLHYFVNTDNAPLECEISVGNKVLLPETGDTVDFSGKHSFAPYESLIVIDEHKPRVEIKNKKASLLPLDGEWQVKCASYNSITLDRCAYSFDGELINDNGYVLDIIPRLCEIRRPVKVEQVYKFNVAVPSDEMFLAVETPEIFEITLNGVNISTKDVGFFRDTAFRMLPIGKSVKNGENVLVFNSIIQQREKTYEHIDNSWTFETMRNCLWYDMELEQIYIVGNFGAEIEEKCEELPLNAYRFRGTPVITELPRSVDIEHLDASGFPEFSGEILLTKNITVDDTNRYVILKGDGINSVHITVNGKFVARKMWAPYEVDISEYLKKGENEIELLIVNNLRNMQGPFHLATGESTHVSPSSFFRESNVFNCVKGKLGDCHDVLSQWSDDTCLVHFGLRSK